MLSMIFSSLKNQLVQLLLLFIDIECTLCTRQWSKWLMYIFLRHGYYYWRWGNWGTEIKTKSFCLFTECVQAGIRILGSWLHTATLQAIEVATWHCFANIKISFKIFQVRSFNPQFWWGIMLFFLSELFWLSAVAGIYSRGLSGLF